MTQPAQCPNCDGKLYAPDPSNGGAGRNKCLECGKASPTAHWYTSRQLFDQAQKNLNALVNDETLGRIVPKLHPPSRKNIERMKKQAIKEIVDNLKPAAPIRQYKDD